MTCSFLASLQRSMSQSCSLASSATFSIFSPITVLLSLFSPFPPQYEPELFPGLIYRMKQPKVVLLIFVSGKVVLTGRATGWACR